MSLSEELLATGRKLLINNYGRAPIVMSRGAGCELWDVDGRRYPRHDRWHRRVRARPRPRRAGAGHRRPGRASAPHLQSLFHQRQIRLAEALGSRALPGKFSFCNSGTEANEAALKLARRYQAVVRGRPNRVEIIAFENSFHGRTIGALSVTGQAKYRQGFGPLLADVRFIPFGDAEAAGAAINGRTRAASPNGMKRTSASSGPKPCLYLAWPVTDSAPMVRPWKLFSKAIISTRLGRPGTAGLRSAGRA